LFTAAVAEGNVVCVPTRAPEASVTDGEIVALLEVSAAVADQANERAITPASSAEIMMKQLANARQEAEVQSRESRAIKCFVPLRSLKDRRAIDKFSCAVHMLFNE